MRRRDSIDSASGVGDGRDSLARKLVLSLKWNETKIEVTRSVTRNTVATGIVLEIMMVVPVG